MLKSIQLTVIASSLALASSLPAAVFTTAVQQGTAASWVQAIWQPGSVSPTAGNTYVGVAGGNPTRLRNPASGSGDAVIGVKTFPGDSLQLDAGSEIRAKGVGNILNFPGVGGNAGLILNGGNIDTGDDGTFGLSGVALVQASSTLTCGDGAQVPRGWIVSAQLRGSAGLQVTKQVNSSVPAVDVASMNNAYSGTWTVKSGTLKGSGYESLGSGSFVIAATNSALVLAQLELNYDINSPGTLTLSGGGRMILHQHCRFTAVTIEGTSLAAGTHTYAELVASFPGSFAPDGSGSITVAPARRVVTVTTINNESPGAGETSLLQALSALQDGDLIRFNIPGAGPHVIQTPLGGYPLITVNNITIDGYSQPGSAPNTNPVLGGNNAKIEIVLDSTGADTAPNPINPALPLRRSTRLDFPNDVGNTGYGSGENCMLGLYQADNATIRGLSFVARRTPYNDEDPGIYAVALIREAANARVQGCWFGLAPGQTNQADVKPPASAVAAFRWRIGGDVYSSGLVVGTDGDGVADRSEFNVMLGGRITLALELPNARIAGNYFNTFPNGRQFLDLDASYQLWRDAFSAGGSDPDDVTVENIENGRVTDDTVIGTNGDGVSDADERNIFNQVVYGHEIEFYSAAKNVVVAGNYFGVGVDGVTVAPASTNASPDLIELPGTASIRVGSNGDGLSDLLEGNTIVKLPGSRYVITGGSSPIVSRLNSMVNDNFKAVPFADGENGSYLSYYAPYLADSSTGVAPVLRGLTNGVLSGTFPAASATYPNVLLDIYVADPSALTKTNNWPAPTTLPLTWLASLTDNGPGDLDPAPNAFRVDLSATGAPAKSYFAASATYSQSATLFTGTNAVTSPMSNPISTNVVMGIRLTSPLHVELSWIAPQGLFTPEWIGSFGGADSWFPLTDPTTYHGGRNIATFLLDAFTDTFFFRIVPQ